MPIRRIELNLNSENDVDISEEIIQELKSVYNSSYLISGYRGVGKTEYVKVLASKIEDEKSIVVNLDIANYESYNKFLRKLARALFLSLDKDVKNSKMPREIYQDIEKLYQQTFYEINSQRKETYTVSDEISQKYSLELQSQRLKYFVLFILNSIPTGLLIFNYNNTILSQQLIYIIMVFIVNCVFLFDFSLSQTQTKKRANHTQRENFVKELYDDEIIDYRLTDILKKLYNEEYKVYIILDEVDKIEDEKLENLIANIKSLLLSKHAVLIVVAGQKLYYEVITSKLKDDGLLNNLFTRNIHVSSWDKYNFEKYFEKLCVKHEDCNNYVSSKIIDAKGLPRNFINAIQEDVIWEENKSLLEINLNQEVYASNAKMLDIVEELNYKYISEYEYYEEGIKDYIKHQMYLWVNFMKTKGNKSFTEEEIFDSTKDSQGINELVREDLKVLIKYLIEESRKCGVVVKVTEENKVKYQLMNKNNSLDETIINSNQLTRRETSIHDLWSKISELVGEEEKGTLYNQYSKKGFSLDQTLNSTATLENKMLEASMTEKILDEILKNYFKGNRFSVGSKPVITSGARCDFVVKDTTGLPIFFEYKILTRVQEKVYKNSIIKIAENMDNGKLIVITVLKNENRLEFLEKTQKDISYIANLYFINVFYNDISNYPNFKENIFLELNNIVK